MSHVTIFIEESIVYCSHYNVQRLLGIIRYSILNCYLLKSENITPYLYYGFIYFYSDEGTSKTIPP